jgi:hypothetical protein
MNTTYYKDKNNTTFYCVEGCYESITEVDLQKQTIGLTNCISLPNIDICDKETYINAKNVLRKIFSNIELSASTEWWSSLNELEKQNLCNLVFNRNHEWIEIKEFDLKDEDIKLLHYYNNL